MLLNCFPKCVLQVRSVISSVVEEAKHVGVTDAVGIPHLLSWGIGASQRDAQLCTCHP